MICPVCRRIIPAGTKFCVYCGFKLGEAPPASAVPPPPSSFPPPGTPGTPGASGWQPGMPPPQRRGLSTTGWIVGCVVGGCLVVILLLVGTAMPNFVRVKGKAKEAEVKQNLHAIQLAVERFRIDHNNVYPEYLTGGEARCATAILSSGGDGAFTGIQDCPSLEYVSDPLIRESYLPSYPKNPFIRDGQSIHAAQEDLRSSKYGEDALRNGSPDGERYGTRFGSDCTRMGSVLADPRYVQRFAASGPGGTSNPCPTWADVEYYFWDMWVGRGNPFPFLPGEFFYKSAGPIEAAAGETGEVTPVKPKRCNQYVLGAYGGTETKGQDVLGEEKQISCGAGAQVWPWTRSVTSTDTKGPSPEGSPYYPAKPGATGPQLMDGNPNAIFDSIIITLSSR